MFATEQGTMAATQGDEKAYNSTHKGLLGLERKDDVPDDDYKEVYDILPTTQEKMEHCFPRLTSWNRPTYC